MSVVRSVAACGVLLFMTAAIVALNSSSTIPSGTRVLTESELTEVTGNDDFCTGCELESIYGDCGQNEDFWDPCGCVEMVRGVIGNPACAPKSLDYRMLDPQKVVERDEYSNNHIPMRENRMCRVEYECDPQEVVPKGECGGALNCVADEAVLTKCRNCWRGDWLDNVSMEAHWCQLCPEI